MSTTAYINGKVYTVDDKSPQVEAFLVNDADGTFAAIGSSDEILKRSPTHTVDLKGQFVMPGLHDAHSHLMLGAFQKLHEASLGWTSGEKETIQKLKAHCSQDSCGVSGAWLIGNFYVQANFPEGKPDRKFLDAEFPDTPVMIREHSCHHVFLNSKGLELAGYTQDDFDNDDKLHGGWFVRKDGEITGECVEAAAKKAYLATPKSKPEVYENAMLYACKMANRFGITSVQVFLCNCMSEIRKHQQTRLYYELSRHLRRKGNSRST
jgi:predicted amidohydrolase YtcJ